MLKLNRLRFPTNCRKRLAKLNVTHFSLLVFVSTVLLGRVTTETCLGGTTEKGSAESRNENNSKIAVTVKRKSLEENQEKEFKYLKNYLNLTSQEEKSIKLALEKNRKRIREAMLEEENKISESNKLSIEEIEAVLPKEKKYRS